MSKAPALLLVANYPSNVGYAWWLMEEFWCALAATAKTQGWRTILVFPELTEVSERLRNAPIQLLQLDAKAALGAERGALSALILRENVRAAYLTDWPYRSLLYARMRWWGVKTLIMHDHMPGERPPIPPVRRLIKRGVHALPYITCDLYIGVSEFIYHRFINRVCLPPSKCTFVRNGIAPIAADARDRQYLRREFGIPTDSIVVVTTGRATEYKRIGLVVRAASRVSQARPGQSIHFVHCGDGPLLPQLKRLIADLAMTRRFILAGCREDVRLLLTSADIAVHASKGEAFSLSILEYMSAGLATIVPDNSGNREAVTDGESGLVVADGDETALADALLQLIDKPELRRRLSQAARRRVAAEFTLERAKGELTAIITRYLDRC